jgi:hypothetical protein
MVGIITRSVPQSVKQLRQAGHCVISLGGILPSDCSSKSDAFFDRAVIRFYTVRKTKSTSPFMTMHDSGQFDVAYFAWRVRQPFGRLPEEPLNPAVLVSAHVSPCRQ